MRYGRSHVYSLSLCHLQILDNHISQKMVCRIQNVILDCFFFKRATELMASAKQIKNEHKYHVNRSPTYSSQLLDIFNVLQRYSVMAYVLFWLKGWTSY